MDNQSTAEVANRAAEKSDPVKEVNERIRETISRFSFHKPSDKDRESMKHVRKAVIDLALAITGSCPESKEKATALTHLSIAMNQAITSIALKSPLEPKEMDFMLKREFFPELLKQEGYVKT